MVMRTEVSSSEDEGGQKTSNSAQKNLRKVLGNSKMSHDEEEIERPRSNSLPNMVLVPEPNMAYQWDTTRNFPEEVELYFARKAQQQRKWIRE